MLKQLINIKGMAENAKNNFFAQQCGLALWFISIVSNNLMQEFDLIDTVRMRVGALPLNVLIHFSMD